MADARETLRGERARAERSAATLEALAAAATTAESERRHVHLVDVAELNVRVTQVVPVVGDAARRCARTGVAAHDRAPPPR